MDDWSEGARQRQQQQQGGGDEQQQEHGLMLVDGASDPRAWLALVQPADPDYLQLSPGSSSGASHGE